MTLSRADQRRKTTRDRARLDQRPEQAPTSLVTLCIVVGCLDPRVGLNLCRQHQSESSPVRP